MQANIVTGAKVYHNQPNIYRLSPEEIADLDRRITRTRPEDESH